MKIALAAGLAVAGLLLAGCDQVEAQANKASACAEALGLSTPDVHLDPDQLAKQAQQRAERLRALANEVSEQDLSQNLGALADSYVDLQKREAEHLSNANDWIQRNAANIDALRKVCL
jgi:hypothetical protein